MPIIVRNMATTIGTSVLEIYRCPVPKLRSVLVRNMEAIGGNTLYLGTRGVSATSGMGIDPKESFSITHQDFKEGDMGDFVLYAVGSAAGTDYAIFEVVLE